MSTPPNLTPEELDRLASRRTPVSCGQWTDETTRYRCGEPNEDGDVDYCERCAAFPALLAMANEGLKIRAALHESGISTGYELGDRDSTLEMVENLCGQHTDVTAENDALRARLTEWEADHAAVMSQACTRDEKHCTCVPHLRARVEELERENSRLRYCVGDEWDAVAADKILTDVESLRARHTKLVEAARAFVGTTDCVCSEASACCYHGDKDELGAVVLCLRVLLADEGTKG